MNLPLESSIWTYTLTNDTFTIPTGQVKSVSVFNGTAVTGTITGTATLAGIPSSAINIVQNKSVSIVASEGANTVGEVVIDAPAGCTLDIICEL